MDPVTLQFLLPLFASVLQGAIGGGLQASETAKQNETQRRMMMAKREQLQPIIDKLQQTRDYFDMEEQLARDFSRASDQMTAQAAQSGMTNAGSGGLDANRADLLGSMIAQLAQAKLADEAQRRQQLVQLLSDDSVYANEINPEDPLTSGLMGALLGGVSGAGSNLAAYLGSEAGIGLLGQALGAKDRPGTLNGRVAVDDGVSTHSNSLLDMLSAQLSRPRPLAAAPRAGFVTPPVAPAPSRYYMFPTQ